MPKSECLRPPNLKALGIHVPAEGEAEPDFPMLDDQATHGPSAVYKTGSKEIRAIIRAMYDSNNRYRAHALLETVYNWQLEYDTSQID